MSLTMSLHSRLTYLMLYVILYLVFIKSGSPESVSERYRRTSYVGQNTTLPCHPRINKDVDWRYRPTETGFEDYVYSNGQMYERFRDRLTVVKSGDGDYDLIIRNVALSDAGLYICIEDLGLGVGYTYDLAVSAGPAPTSVMLTLPPFAAADSHTSAVAIPVSVSLIILVIIVGLVLLYLCRKRLRTKCFADTEAPVVKHELESMIAPRDVTVVEKSSHMIRLRWAYGDVVGMTFLVRYRPRRATEDVDGDDDDDDGDTKWTQTESTTTTECTVTGLLPATVYLLRVVAQNEAGYSGSSGIISLETDLQPLTLDLVAPEITDVKCGADYVTLSWKLNYKKELVMYVVKYQKKKKSESEARWHEIPDIRDQTFTVQDLLPSTLYLVQVTAYTDTTRSPASEEKECRTTRVLPRPPTRLLVAQTTPTSITLAWFTDTVEPVSFTIQYRPSRRTPADDRWMTVNDIATIEHTVTGLQSFTEYEMRVVAVGEAGNSEPSDMVEVRTLKTSPVEMQLAVVQADKRLRGYSFNERGQLRDKGGRPFVFKVHESNDRNQKRYDSIGEAITDEVYKLLETRCGLQKVLLPCGVQPNEPHSFIFTTPHWMTSTDRLLILIHGSGVVRAGQWTRKLIMNEDLDKGSQIPYIERAIKDGFEVVVLNTNLNKCPDVSRDIGIKVDDVPGSESPEKHALYVWKELISPYVNAQHVAIVAHSYGGIVVMEMMKESPDEFKSRVYAVAFTESVHSPRRIPDSAGTFFAERARNWVTVNNLEPVGQPLPDQQDLSGRDAPRVSCGHSNHEWSSHSSKDSVFQFLTERYTSRLREHKADITDGDGLMGYMFNQRGELRDKYGRAFKFDVYDDRRKNQDRYERLGEAITEEVYKLLEDQCQLRRVYIPVDGSRDLYTQPESVPHSFFFVSRNWMTTTDRLLVLIHGSGVVRAGQWARRLIVNNSLREGTQIAYIERAVQQGYEVVVLNTNLSKFPDVGRVNGNRLQDVPGSENPMAHAVYVWKELIEPRTKAQNIAVVAHSFGGLVVTHLVSSEKDEFLKRVFAIAFTESSHTTVDVPDVARSFFTKHAQNWVSSDLPVGTPVTPHHSTPEIGDAPQVSAGHKLHEWTSHSSFDSVFQFLNDQYQQRVHGAS